MGLAPFNSCLETLMRLVGTCNKDIEVNVLDNVVHTFVHYNFIHIANSFDHVQPFLCCIDKFGFWFVSEHYVRILYGHD